MNEPLWMWAGFFAIVLVLLVFDLGLLNRRRERLISVRESLKITAVYILISVAFGVGVWHYLGPQEGKDFFTGYIVEKSLSVDNLFVISLVFMHFQIPERYQQRVLLCGLLGAIVLRGLMIGIGVILLQQIGWILYVFSAFLIYSGIKIFFASSDEEESLNDNKILNWLQRHISVTTSHHGNQFFAMEPNAAGKLVRKCTPIMLALVFIELADIVFAVDSVPAVFAVTTNPFIVYSSNIFAILGLRALYFSLSAVLSRFSYMNYALALVLMFIGGKIFAVPFIGKISSSVSLGVTFLLLLGGVLVSLYKTRADTNTK